MENVRNFFNEMDSKISEDIEYFEHDSEHKYRKLRSIDFQKIRFYRNKIADKLFSINKDDREIYAGLMIQEIDANNFGEDLTQKKERIGERNYKLYSIKNELGKEEFVDVSEIVDDCEFFVVWVFELFLSFHINMLDVIKKFDLLHDYSGFADLEMGALKRYEENKEKYFDNLKNKNSPVTTARQVMAIETILSHFNIIPRITADKTVIAAFFQFITGRQSDLRPQDTNAYKLIGEGSEKRKRLSTYNDDCDFVAMQFDKVGLGKFAKAIRTGKEKIV